MGICKEQLNGLKNKDKNIAHDRDQNYKDIISKREELRDMKESVEGPKKFQKEGMEYSNH